MSMTNCINCGASKEVSDLQCPFCGTKYTDLSTIELFSDKPLFIQLKGRDGNVTTAKAYVTGTHIDFYPDVSCLYDMKGMVHKNITAMNITGSIDFSLYESIV